MGTRFSVSGAALLLLGLAPGVLLADIEIDATMQIVEDLDELGDVRVRKVEPADVEVNRFGEVEEDFAATIRAAGFADDFAYDNAADDLDDDLLAEGDFEESELVDDDDFDEEAYISP